MLIIYFDNKTILHSLNEIIKGCKNKIKWYEEIWNAMNIQIWNMKKELKILKKMNFKIKYKDQ